MLLARRCGTSAARPLLLGLWGGSAKVYGCSPMVYGCASREGGQRRQYGIARRRGSEKEQQPKEKDAARKVVDVEHRAFEAMERFRREGELGKMLQRLVQYRDLHKKVSPRLFISMLQGFVHDDRKVDARRLLGDRARFGLEGRPSAAEEELMLKLECKTRDRAAATRVFEGMGRGGRKRRLRAYGMLLTVLAKEGDAQAAEELVAGMSVDCVQPDRVAWNLLLQAHARAGCKEGARSVLQRMEEKNCKADKRTFRHLVCAHVNAGDLEGAEDVLDKNLHNTDGVAVAHLMRGMCKAGKAQEAEATVLEMAKLAAADKAHTVQRLDAAAAAVLEHGWLPLKQGRRAARLVLHKLPAVDAPLSDRMFELAKETCEAAGESKQRKELQARQRLLKFREEEKLAKKAAK